MAHIDLGLDETQFPGVTGLMRYRPETGKLLNETADLLLRSEPHPLSRGERELIAAYVSGLNECKFCAGSHSAIAAVQLDEGMALVEQVHADLESADVSPKMRALLRIAEVVREDGRMMTIELADAARAQGATDLEIHDTVLITAVFCMINRYVDGLGTILSPDPNRNTFMAQKIAEHGYAGVAAMAGQMAA